MDNNNPYAAAVVVVVVEGDDGDAPNYDSTDADVDVDDDYDANFPLHAADTVVEGAGVSYSGEVTKGTLILDWQIDGGAGALMMR